MRCHALVAAAATAVMCLTPAALKAEPIVITSGSAFVGPGPNTVSLTGTNGFSLATHLGFGNSCLSTSCSFGPGQPLETSGGWFGGDVLGGTVTVEGVTYVDFGGLNSPVGLSLEFFGESVPAPAVQAGSSTVQVPFTFDGLFRYQPFGPDPESFSRQIVGEGIATLTIFGVEAGTPRARWDSQSIRWDFRAPRDVPEPAMLSLLCLGVACGAMRRKRRAPSCPARRRRNRCV